MSDAWQTAAIHVQNNVRSFVRLSAADLAEEAFAQCVVQLLYNINSTRTLAVIADAFFDAFCACKVRPVENDDGINEFLADDANDALSQPFACRWSFFAAHNSLLMGAVHFLAAIAVDDIAPKKELKRLFFDTAAASRSVNRCAFFSASSETERFVVAACSDKPFSVVKLHPETEENPILPLSATFDLQHGSKAVCALALNEAGSRLFTASNDFVMKFWDFHTMGPARKHFRVVPQDEHRIHQLAFSPLTNCLLLANDSASVRIYDREGFCVGQTMRGDAYLRDVRHTKGHTAAVNCVDWAPHTAGSFASGAADGTVRFWHSGRLVTQQSAIVTRASPAQPQAAVTGLRFDASGKRVLLLCTDGSLRAYPAATGDRDFPRPLATIAAAHVPGSEGTVSISAADSFTFATRSTDSTLKIWDARNLTASVHVINDVPNIYAEANAAFSACGGYVAIGTSFNAKTAALNDGGFVKVFSTATGELVDERCIPKASVTAVAWHPKLNQIFAGTSVGTVVALYDAHASERGAKQALAADPKPKVRGFVTATDAAAVGDAALPAEKIYTPHSLPLYDDYGNSEAFARRKMLRDPQRTKRPEPPIAGPGSGGKIGTSNTAKIMRRLIDPTAVHEDSREAILRYAQAAAAEPFWSAPAYRHTQPTPIFAPPDNPEAAFATVTAENVPPLSDASSTPSNSSFVRPVQQPPPQKPQQQDSNAKSQK